MKPKFPQMSKAEILALAQDVSASLKTIGAAELDRLTKAEGSSSSSSSSISPEGSLGKTSASPEKSLGKASFPAEGSSPSASSGSSEGSSSEGSSPGDSLPPGPSDSAPPGADASAPPAGPPPSSDGSAPPGADGSAPPPPGADGSAPPGGAPEGPSFEELVDLYTSLPPEVLEQHAAAMQQAMSKGGATAPPGAGAPPSAPPEGVPPMGKQEVATATKTGPTIGLEPGHDTPAKVATANPNIGKSEGDIGSRLAKAEEALVKMVEIMTTPIRKAQTGLTYLPYQGTLNKSEPMAPLKKSVGDMTHAEVREALMKVTSLPTLTKSEREVINDFYLKPGTVKLSDLESIINKA